MYMSRGPLLFVVDEKVDVGPSEYVSKLDLTKLEVLARLIVKLGVPGSLKWIPTQYCVLAVIDILLIPLKVKAIACSLVFVIATSSETASNASGSPELSEYIINLALLEPAALNQTRAVPPVIIPDVDGDAL